MPPDLWPFFLTARSCLRMVKRFLPSPCSLTLPSVLPRSAFVCPALCFPSGLGLCPHFPLRLSPRRPIVAFRPTLAGGTGPTGSCRLCFWSSPLVSCLLMLLSCVSQFGRFTRFPVWRFLRGGRFTGLIVLFCTFPPRPPVVALYLLTVPFLSLHCPGVVNTPGFPLSRAYPGTYSLLFYVDAGCTLLVGSAFSPVRRPPAFLIARIRRIRLAAFRRPR